ncbi:MAG: enoyl-CoA hydratase-related protein [Pseudomonadota bacterium]
MGGYETIRYEIDASADAPVAVIRLARPEKMNAMNRAMRLELGDAFARAGAEARALLITGAEAEGFKPAFCAGQDLEDVRASDLRKTLDEEYGPAFRGLIELPIPSVAAVNGAAAGAGAHLAMCADICFAARSAKFVEPFARLGLIPAGTGSYWLPRRVGMARALGMTLLGEPLAAEQAEEWGLIWRAVDDAALWEVSEATANRLAAGPTAGFRLTKEALRASPTNDLSAQLALERELQGEASDTADYAEGVQAFLEKRPPRFEGR